MIRVVIDTNVLISAVIQAHGSEARVLNLVASGELLWFTSVPILDEYKGVLARPKFASLDPNRVARSPAILEIATIVLPTVT